MERSSGDELFSLLKAYRDAVNSVLEELRNSTFWKKLKEMEKKQEQRLLRLQ